ncbi:MAG: homoaconitate hydratase [Deltaproteobacteria bacterium]|nr:homoaconitate hydratase [Deltaproteobacteria bacterium]
MITLVDTTLRDGEQAPGAAFTIGEKVEIAKALSAVGIKEIEAGTPVMGGDEAEAVKAVIGFVGAPYAVAPTVKIFTWNRVLEKDIEASLSCGAENLYISCPVSDIQIQNKLRKTRDWVKERFTKIIPAIKKEGCYAACGLEDASRADVSFVLEVCRQLEELQADRIRICDTVGILTPFKTFELIAYIRRHVKIPVEIHTHNDFGMATANALAGIKGGAEYASVTVNGMGERAGNAALEEVVMTLEKLEGIKTGVNTKMLKQLSFLVSRFSGRPVAPDKPIVGDMAFNHESGIHVDGVLKEPSNYEPFFPEEAGNRRGFYIGKHTGQKTLEKLQYITDDKRGLGFGAGLLRLLRLGYQPVDCSKNGYCGYKDER